MERAALIGMGQIGGSLGMALLRRGLAREVVGIDRDPRALKAALARKACTFAAGDLAPVALANLVVLATPVRSIVALARGVRFLLPAGAVATDVGSAKAAVMRAYRGLRGFAGGHPMAGTERGGIAAADPDLFEGATWVLVPGDDRAVRDLSRLVRRLGARPAVMTAAAHDRAASLASHLPYCLAVALSRLAGPNPPLAAGSFRSATRVAAQPLEMSLDILLANRFQIARDLGRMGRQMSRLATLLVKGDEAALRRFIESARP
ncbi:MAG: prephenate dehydrogenase [Planctomycetia bacterium]|nr:prephenate dehydrogenase [Planctomycetia bacterium]